MALHAGKKLRQRQDANRSFDPAGINLSDARPFIALPKAEDAPPALREALRQDVERIISGRWLAFTHLELRVDDPPRWHKDYLAGVDLETNESAFQLNHRNLPRGADVKLIWELSRWYELTRLAMAAYVLNDERAGLKCLEWLEDWVKHNPPYRGWNWTSALEAGMRLVQFTWIDELLSSASATFNARLLKLRVAILPAHVWFTWRHKSFGSSANNHLIGEVVGLILATVRWPQLAKCGANLDVLDAIWRTEVLNQFASDGGNKEQALNYQLFSFELCWLAREALQVAGKSPSDAADERLFRAAQFFWDVQVAREPWDYGDSDNAYAVPVFLNPKSVVAEWRRWVAGQESAGVQFWLGDIPHLKKQGAPQYAKETGPWWHFPDSGIAIVESGFWFLRWDLSPLGYLKTAAHGHLDALHLSIWYRGVAFIVDPGTGAYYGDKALRHWLASRTAHNSPCPAGPEQPQRLGPFLWKEDHLQPTLCDDWETQTGVLNLVGVQLRRKISRLHPAELVWQVEDSCVLKNGEPGEFSVRWQFAPGTRIKKLGPGAGSFVIKRFDEAMQIDVSGNWAEIILVETKEEQSKADPDNPLAGVVSSAFRKTEWAPYLKLIARPQPGESCVFRTTFVASPPS